MKIQGSSLIVKNTASLQKNSGIKNSEGFSGALDKVKSASNSTKSEVVSYIQQFQTQWKQSHAQKIAMVKKLPSSYRSLLEGQILVSDLSMKSQIVSKVGEGVSSTVKKVQSFGS